MEAALIDFTEDWERGTGNHSFGCELLQTTGFSSTGERDWDNHPLSNPNRISLRGNKLQVICLVTFIFISYESGIVCLRWWKSLSNCKTAGLIYKPLVNTVPALFTFEC